jgi:predicted nucleic acid-binding protein
MNCSSFPNSHSGIIVADASVLINLNATGHMEKIIAASCGVLHTTANAYAEFLDGERCGYGDTSKLTALRKTGALEVVELSAAEEPIYRSLIEGSAARTLDDGEAATVAYAVRNGAIALIDERKAQRICGARFQDTKVVTTTDLLLHESVVMALGSDHIEAIHAALVHARMHVPRHLIETVVELLGADRSLECTSLPRRVVAGGTR